MGAGRGTDRGAIRFEEPCVGVAWFGALLREQTFYASGNSPTLDIVYRHLDPAAEGQGNGDKVVGLEYRIHGCAGLPVVCWKNISAEIHASSRFVTARWAVPDAAAGRVDIRARTTCLRDQVLIGESVTATLTGVIDRASAGVPSDPITSLELALAHEQAKTLQQMQMITQLMQMVTQLGAGLSIPLSTELARPSVTLAFAIDYPTLNDTAFEEAVRDTLHRPPYSIPHDSIDEVVVQEGSTMVRVVLAPGTDSGALSSAANFSVAYNDVTIDAADVNYCAYCGTQEPAQTSASGSSSSSDTAVAAAIVLAVALAAALVVIAILIRQQRKQNVPILPRSVIPDATFTRRVSHIDPSAVVYDTATQRASDDSFSMPGQIRSRSSTAAGPAPRPLSVQKVRKSDV